MPRASKGYLEEKIWKKIKEDLVRVVSELELNELRKFLEEFLTKEEKTMLAKRLAIYSLLIQGATDKQIKDSLKVSFETIRLMRASLESKSLQFKKRLEEKGENRLFKTLGIILKAKSNKAARAKLASGDF